jgi:hypothetical protein
MVEIRLIRLLLHAESGKEVFPVWEEVEKDGVSVFKDLMGDRQSSDCTARVQYHRVPITAEQAPDFSDISHLLELIIKSDLQNTAIVLNDQLGRGRSTMASVRQFTSILWSLTKVLSDYSTSDSAMDSP